MNDNYNENKKNRNKIEMIGYGIFLIIVLIIDFASRGNSTELNDIMDNYNSSYSENNTNEKNVISLFDKYTYSIEATINDKNYIFNGKYDNDILTINKVDGDNTIKYEYKNNYYYLVDTNEMVSENIYSPLDSKYLNIDLINQYLNVSKYEDNQYRVYLKDIVLGNTSDEYITISYTSNLNEINISVNYTNLFKNFNNDIEKYLVVMKYNKVID